jgi:alkylation response protein AidB-like acyl-CoA dehydrogenase
MDYQLSPQEVKMQQELAAFCRTEIAPRAKMLDSSSRPEAGAYMKENLKMLSQGGCLEAGHAGDVIDLIAVYLAGEEIAKACPATFLSARASTFLCAGALRLFGASDQKQRYISDLMKAERIGAFAYSEEQAGSDMAAITTVARRDGKTWRLSGDKNVVVNAPIADVFLVLAYSEKDAGAQSGMSIFICEKGARGLSIGKPVETMGLRGVPLAGIYLDDCVAAGILGGTPGKGYEQATRILTMGKVGIAALCVGIGNACMEISVKHSKERKAFGKPIGLYLGRMLALRAAWAINTGEYEADIMAACAKLFASEAVTKIANWGMQIFAGHGYVAGSDIERFYRDAKFGEICEGASEIQRSLIARSELDKFLPR